MNAYRIQTTVSETGTLTLYDLPFKAGISVIVIVSKVEDEDDTVQPSNQTESDESE